MLVAAESWAGDDDCMLVPILRTMVQLNERVADEGGAQLLQDDFVEECGKRIENIEDELATAWLNTANAPVGDSSVRVSDLLGPSTRW